MTKYLNQNLASLNPYVPGEQPNKNEKFIKLNTNENPFPLTLAARREVQHNAKNFHLYPDPDSKKLRTVISSVYGLSLNQIMLTNGSDEGLNFIFQAFCSKGVAFADITYGFYPVFANLYNLNTKVIPLQSDFSIKKEDYYNLGRTIVIANPNAPTGLALTPSDIRDILDHNRDNLVVIDEAYVDFGAESVVPLTKQYDNLVVVQTFSKSRFLAGLRIGMMFANPELIADLNAVRNSVNPYNLNAAALACGYVVMRAEKHKVQCCNDIIETRNWTSNELKKLGFKLTDSRANFIFATTPKIKASDLYLRLKERGILVRYFAKERIDNYLRISIGTLQNMKTFIKTVKQILEEV